MNALYLHAGIDKTGSTAIQQFLHRNREVLRSGGVNYVQASRGGDYHHSRLWNESLAGELAAWEAVRDEVAGSPIRTHVVSHEGLYALDGVTLGKVRRILDGIDLRVVVYLRRQSDFVCSGLAQRAKQRQEKPLDDYSEREVVSLGKDYEQLLDKLLALVDEERLIVRCYEPSGLVNGSILEDFFAVLGSGLSGDLIAKAARERNANPTPPVEVVQGLERLRRLHLPDAMHHYLCRAVMSRFPGDGSTFLSDRTLDKIDRRQARTNRRVAERWFGRRELFCDARKFGFREVRPELDKAFWACVWGRLAGYGLQAWGGEKTGLHELLNAGRAILLESDERSMTFLVRMPAVVSNAPSRLSVTVDDAGPETVELTVEGEAVHVGSGQSAVEIGLDGAVIAASRNLVEVTLRRPDGHAPPPRTVKLALVASAEADRRSRTAS